MIEDVTLGTFYLTLYGHNREGSWSLTVLSDWCIKQGELILASDANEGEEDDSRALQWLSGHYMECIRAADDQGQFPEFGISNGFSLAITTGANDGDESYIFAANNSAFICI